MSFSLFDSVMGYHKLLASCLQLLRQLPCPVTVQHTADGRGKGVFVTQVAYCYACPALSVLPTTKAREACTQEIAAEQVIFRELPFVADQHLANKDDALVCSHCFRFLGSVELQAAWRLRVVSGETPYCSSNCTLHEAGCYKTAHLIDSKATITTWTVQMRYQMTL